MKLRGCYIGGLPPFGEQEMQFPSKAENSTGAEIHLIAGVNGAGKTRFLSLLESSLGNDSDLASRIGQRPKASVWAGHQDLFYRWTAAPNFFKCKTQPKDLDGSKLERVSEGEVDMFPKNDVRKRRTVSAGFSGIPGTFALSFRGSLRIRDAQIQAQAPVRLGNLSGHLSFDIRPNEEAQMVSQAIANIVSMGSQEIMQDIPDGRYGKLLRRVNQVLKQFLQKKTAFFVDSRGTKISLQVLLENDRIDLEHLPDGLRSMIAWLFATIAKLEVAFPNDVAPLEREFVMLLDEPETHLHPAWQRFVLRIAQELFPNAQIIVATHSPFIISSINNGWIHILRAGDDGLIYFDKPLECSEGDTYMDAVEDVLGIKEMYDPETEEMLSQYRDLREDVIAEGFKGEEELRALMMKIGSRSASLENMMGRELFQLDKAKQLQKVS